MARQREEIRRERYQKFVVELARTNDPVEAARLSGHPAQRALETLRDMGFTFSVPERMDVAA